MLQAEIVPAQAGMAAAAIGFRGPVAAVLLSCMLASCAGDGDAAMAAAQRAYALYDTRFDRSLVAGHDDVRGNFVEVRVSPRGGDGKAVVR